MDFLHAFFPPFSRLNSVYINHSRKHRPVITDIPRVFLNCSFAFDLPLSTKIHQLWTWIITVITESRGFLFRNNDCSGPSGAGWKKEFTLCVLHALSCCPSAGGMLLDALIFASSAIWWIVYCFRDLFAVLKLLLLVAVLFPLVFLFTVPGPLQGGSCLR